MSLKISKANYTTYTRLTPITLYKGKIHNIAYKILKLPIHFEAS